MGIDHRGHNRAPGQAGGRATEGWPRRGETSGSERVKGHRERLRELARVSGRLVEFSVAWARRLKGLKPETVRKLQEGLREQTRQVGGKLGEGADFNVYESFTPGRGRTVTKVLKERSVLKDVKNTWAAVAASPAGRHSALPLAWHKAGYVQDRMLDPQFKPISSRFAKKISSGFETERAKLARTQGERRMAKMGLHDDWGNDVYAMPQGAHDSELTIRHHYKGNKKTGKVHVEATNIMLDPRRRRLVLTDPLGWQSSGRGFGWNRGQSATPV
ncbi:MAG: hypothetical protein EBY32_10820 [Proteobacteria bacterium]|nr:hypothetical protein [Pseudomonadota bacterium]